MLRVLLPLVVFALGACRVFDETLLERDAGTDPAGFFPLADRCDLAVPTVTSSATAFRIDTTSLDARYTGIACTDTTLPGNEGFVAIDMTAGERWHFHITTAQAAPDPALYVLDTCDERSCQQGWGIDDCGDGRAEHMSFVAPRTGRYLVGVDSKKAGGGVYELLVTRPVCGNGGKPEHSETCDDGNMIAGDGCDAQCRVELAGARASEVEPNDDAGGANMAIPPTLEVQGRIAGRCDRDLVGVTVAAGGAVSAKLSFLAGPCSALAGKVSLWLLAGNGETKLAMGAADANGCLAVAAQGLPAGTYYLALRTTEADNLEYLLEVAHP